MSRGDAKVKLSIPALTAPCPAVHVRVSGHPVFHQPFLIPDPYPLVQMSPDADQQETPANISNREYLTPTWCSLPWTPWVPFSATKEEFRTIPKEPGLYRIRPAGKEFFMYIGETRRQLHWRLHELRHTLQRGELMPWNEPMTEAPCIVGLAGCRRTLVRVFCGPTGRFAERKTGDAELPPLPVPAGTR